MPTPWPPPPPKEGVAGLERFKGDRVATGESHLDKVSEGEMAIKGDEHLETLVVEQGVKIWPVMV